MNLKFGKNFTKRVGKHVFQFEAEELFNPITRRAEDTNGELLEQSMATTEAR